MHRFIVTLILTMASLTIPNLVNATDNTEVRTFSTRFVLIPGNTCDGVPKELIHHVNAGMKNMGLVRPKGSVADLTLEVVIISRKLKQLCSLSMITSLVSEQRLNLDSNPGVLQVTERVFYRSFGGQIVKGDEWIEKVYESVGKDMKAVTTIVETQLR